MQKLLAVLAIFLTLILSGGAAIHNGLTGLYVGIIITLFLFIAVSIASFKSDDTQKGFLLANLKCSREEFGSSLASTNIPLVLGILFFYQFGQQFGFLVVILLSLIAIIPFALMICMRKRTGKIAIANLTLHEIIYFATGKSKASRKTAAIITVISFFLAVGFELYFGSQIIGYMLQINLSWMWVIGLVLAVIAGIYASFGGLRSVFKTDMLQYIFIFFAIIAAFIIVLTASNQNSVQDVKFLFERGQLLDVIFLVIGSLFFYPLWYFSTMDTWQRQAVSSNIKSVGSWQFIGGCLVIFIYLGAGFLGASKLGMSSETGLVGIIIGAISSDLWVIRVFAAVVGIGIISALLSTIDTYSIMGAQALDIDIFGKDWRDDDSSERSLIPRRIAVLLFAPISYLVIAFILVKFIYADPYSLFYVAYAAQSTLAFFVLSGIFSVSKNNNISGERPNYMTLVTGSWGLSQRPNYSYSIVLGLGACVAITIAILVESSNPIIYLTPVIAAFFPILILLWPKSRRNS